MKKIVFIGLLISTTIAFSQQSNDKEAIRRACMDYIEGFYQGDTLKLKRSLQPSLNKLGFFKAKDADIYAPQGYMTYEKAINYAKNVLAKKRFAKETAPKKVEIFDVGNVIATAKVTAWWGIDYMLLSKQNDKWMIEQVIWEGPLEK